MNPVQYIIANHTLNMPPGKLAAQVAHASVEGLRLNAKETWGNPWDSTIVNRWYRGGHYAKIVLQSEDLATAERYLNDRGFTTALIIDEGRTVFNGDLTPTAIGCPVLDKNDPHVAETFSAFKLYERQPYVILESDKRLSYDARERLHEHIRNGDLDAARELLRFYNAPASQQPWWRFWR